MIIKRIEGATRILGKPKDWNDDGLKCLGLPIRDVVTEGIEFMVSAWEPSPEELKALNNGESVKLWIQGFNHPVVALSVGPLE